MSGKVGRSGRPIEEGGVTGVLDGMAAKTRAAHRALFETFCCAQVERVQSKLSTRYGRTAAGPGPRNFLMPQNDHMTPATLTHNAHKGSDDCQDTYVEVRGTIVGYEGPQRASQS